MVSGGPIEPITIGRDIIWDMHSKQGVFLLPNLNNSSIHNKRKINFDVIFDPNEGDLKFSVE